MKTHAIISKLLLVLCLIGFTTTATATNYYASPNGTGGGTSLADTCSLTTGLSKLTAGSVDTLFLYKGTYNQTAKISLTKSGTASARLAIFAIPGDTVIIDFRGQDYTTRGFEVSGNYLHVKGLTIQYAGDNGMHITSSYNIIENCVFHANSDAGLQISGSSTGGVGNLIKNCDSYDNFDYETGGTTAADFGGNADGFADKLFDNITDTNTYEGCRSWNNSDDGWDMYNRKGISILKNCWCYANGPASRDMTNFPRYAKDKTWFDQFPMTVTIKGGTTSPTITLASYTNYGNGNGFKVGGDYRNNTVTLENCLSANNKVRGFDQNNNAGAMTLYNCTAFNNSPNYGFSDKTSSSSASNPTAESPATNATLIIKNCVSLSSTATNTWTSSTYLTSSNNSWSGVVTCNSADFIATDPSVMTSSRQADGSLPNIVFMQLATGSDLIDAGTNVSLAYSGSAPDMGCFELGNLDQYPGAVTTPTNITQTVIQGTAIANIVFTWSAGATGLSATGLPDGITTTIDNTAKTLTLSGTPSVIGSFTYSITTVGGSGSAATVSGKIVSVSASAKKIAYFTTLPTTAPDAAILNKLQSNTDFLVTTVDATSSTTDYSSYDLVVMSPVPSSAAAGFPVLEALDKPKLLLKPFTLKNTVWNWGVAANTALSTITVTNKTHEIFTGLTFTGTSSDELILFNTVSTNGVTGITSWYGTPAATPTLLATPQATTGSQSIVEMPVGIVMGPTGLTTTTTQRFLMIGVSESSTASLTATATQLIQNSCYYLMGMSIPTGIEQVKTSTNNFKLIQTESSLEVVTNEVIKGLDLYTPAGNKIASSNGKTISIGNLTQGVYIVLLKGETETKYAKFIKK